MASFRKVRENGRKFFLLLLVEKKGAVRVSTVPKITIKDIS